MLAMPQMRPAKTEPAPNTSGQGPKQILVTYEGASSPRELLENCIIQAQAALKGLQATAAKDETEKTTEEEEMELRLSARELANREALNREEEKQNENFQLSEFW